MKIFICISHIGFSKKIFLSSKYLTTVIWTSDDLSNYTQISWEKVLYFTLNVCYKTGVTKFILNKYD